MCRQKLSLLLLAKPVAKPVSVHFSHAKPVKTGVSSFFEKNELTPVLPDLHQWQTMSPGFTRNYDIDVIGGRLAVEGNNDLY